MTGSETDDENGSIDGEIHTEIKTNVSHDGNGTVYAVQTVQAGDRRVDYKIGHLHGDFAEGFDYYYKGEMFHRSELTKSRENAPLGKYRDETFRELLDMDISLEDGKLIEKRVYAAEEVDATEWAAEHLDGLFLPETLLEEYWEDQKSRYDPGKFE